ncbi:hypothetical protein [Photobacterium andalusiense]|uniref:Uncharacterized protein n=1 Tax=Photobacterium andalusiense TaxID=2204296 RepID=A0A1Y6MHJ4_9GAMM|nr:hypothetical protein [Photobacterium andalusiense]SMY35389.1 hypothetical protein PAND9192_02062 [Photobacterium andalusiense]
MTENITIEVSNCRNTPKKVSIKAYCNKDKNLTGTMVIPLDQYESAGLIQSLTLGQNNNNQIISDRCKALLNYIASGATIRMNCYAK